MAILVTSLLAAALAKLCFGAIGWFTRDHEDPIFRKHLDRLYDQLVGRSPRELVRQFFSRFMQRWEATFGNGRVGFLRFSVLSITGNIIAILLNQPRSFPFTTTSYLVFVALYGLVGIVPDLAFSKISIALIRSVALRGRVWHVAIFCGLDVTLLFVSVLANILITFFILTLVLPQEHLSLQVELSDLLTFPANLVKGQALWQSVIVLAAASMQTACYFCLGLVTAVYISMPRVLHNVLSRCVYNITTDKSPVFSQLGNLAGALAAGLTALVAFIRSQNAG